MCDAVCAPERWAYSPGMSERRPITMIFLAILIVLAIAVIGWSGWSFWEIVEALLVIVAVVGIFHWLESRNHARSQ
jgi:hypothetical protein